MADFGLTDQGFVLKRFEDIEADLQTALRASFGPGINVSPDGRFGKLISDVAKPLADLWELSQAAVDALDPDNAEGVSLDNVAAFLALTRLAATNSFVDVTFFGSNGTVLPIGSQASVDGSGDKFQVSDAAVTIDQVLQQHEVWNVEVVNGATYQIDIDGTLHSYVAGPSDTEATILQALADDINANSPSQIVAYINQGNGRLNVSAATPADSFAANSVTASISFPIIAADATAETVTIAGDLVSLFQATQGFSITGSTGNDGSYNVSGAVLTGGNTVITVTGDILSSVGDGTLIRNVQVVHSALSPVFGKVAQVDSVEAGQILAPEMSLINIETPVSGWDGVFNPAAATPGRAVETDQELRLRREQSSQIAGSATAAAIQAALLQVEGVTAAFVYVNDTDVVDSTGTPAHSIQAVVVGGQDLDIAEAILATKSAGIGAAGSEGLFLLEDSQGVEHSISFTRPVDVDVHLVYNLTLDPEQGTYPPTGDDQVKALAVAFGNATFGIGQNVAPWRLIGAITVPGIGEIELLLKAGSTPGPSDTGAIVIDPTEIARFAVLDVDVNQV